MQGFQKFVVMLVIVSLCFALVLYFFIPTMPDKFRYENWWKILLFFFFTTGLFHFGLLKSINKRPAALPLYYLATTTVKLLLYIGIIIGYALLHKENAPAFISTFFLMYLVFTVFEVGVLYKKFSSSSQTTPK